jgi:hypothetical protein
MVILVMRHEQNWAPLIDDGLRDQCRSVWCLIEEPHMRSNLLYIAKRLFNIGDCDITWETLSLTIPHRYWLSAVFQIKNRSITETTNHTR